MSVVNRVSTGFGGKFMFSAALIHEITFSFRFINTVKQDDCMIGKCDREQCIRLYLKGSEQV